MFQQDPFAYRRIFNFCLSYAGVVLLFLCYDPVRGLFREPVTPERVRETAGAIGALLPVVMAVAAAVAGMVRKVLFHYSGVNRRSLTVIFLLGTFWHLPLTLLLAYVAAPHEPAAWYLPPAFTGIGAIASLVLVFVLFRLPHSCLDRDEFAKFKVSNNQ